MAGTAATGTSDRGADGGGTAARLLRPEACISEFSSSDQSERGECAPSLAQGSRTKAIGERGGREELQAAANDLGRCVAPWSCGPGATRGSERFGIDDAYRGRQWLPAFAGGENREDGGTRIK